MFEKITRRADCANKRRIYKLGMRYLRKWVRIEYLKKLQDAPIAQIKGEFINSESDICESGWDRMFEKITRRADCANKRRIYKLGMVCLRKWVG